MSSHFFTFKDISNCFFHPVANMPNLKNARPSGHQNPHKSHQDQHRRSPHPSVHRTVYRFYQSHCSFPFPPYTIIFRTETLPNPFRTDTKRTWQTSNPAKRLCFPTLIYRSLYCMSICIFSCSSHREAWLIKCYHNCLAMNLS